MYSILYCQLPQKVTNWKGNVLACVFWPGSVSLSKQSTNSNIDSTTTSCFMTKWLKLQNFIKISYFFKFGNIGFFIMTFHQQNLETTGVWKLASVVSNRNAGGLVLNFECQVFVLSGCLWPTEVLEYGAGPFENCFYQNSCPVMI